jgi:hypothetical protein
MENVTFIEITDSISGVVVEHAVIENEDGSFISMTKEHYESIQAEQSTPIVTADE